MINPGAIPQIPGDMGALSAHAAGVGTAGTGIADTGSDVHANWQALAPAYTAPESGQLLQATAPVAQVAGNIGRDVEQVSGALKAYADEVRPIQQRLRDLKAQAEQLVADIHSYENQKPSNSELAASAKTGIVPDKDWTDDGDLVDRDAHIMSAVNQAVADWMAAQRRCANTITALYGGTHYTADNADGHQTAGEYGYTADQLTAAAGSDEGLPWGKTEDTSNPLSDIGHFVLDLGGLIPGIGELADGANASWYAAEGDYTNAGLSAAAMIPFAGWGATGGKLLGKGAKEIKAASEISEESAEVTAKNVGDQVGDGPVVFRGRSHWTADEHEQLRKYVEASEKARKEGHLAENGRVSTQGELRAEANRAAMAERLRAKKAGEPYQGQAGHVPDTTWTGRPEGYEWHDQTSRVNASLGAQARQYPEGYRPSEFQVGEPRD